MYICNYNNCHSNNGTILSRTPSPAVPGTETCSKRLAEFSNLKGEFSQLIHHSHEPAEICDGLGLGLGYAQGNECIHVLCTYLYMYK